MRPFLLLYVTFLNLGMSQMAFAQAPQEEWEGYLSVRDANLRPKIRDFAQSAVFQIISVGSTNLTGDNFEIIDPNLQQRITDKRTLDTNYRALQIETCYKQNLRKCPVTVNARAGTIFLNRGKFYTCRHLFHNWLHRASIENNRNVKSLAPPMILRDANMEVVYNSAYANYSNSDSHLTMDFLQTNSVMNVHFEDNDQYSQYSDFRYTFKLFDIVRMTMSQPFGVDAQLAETTNVIQDLQNASSVYLFGFPTFTDKLQNKSVGYVAGEQLLVSHGNIEHAYSAGSDKFSTTAYNSEGISGGPVVTKDGLILGIHCTSGLPSNDPAYVTSSPYVMNMDFLENLWEDRDYPLQ